MTHESRPTSVQVRSDASKTRTHASTPDPAASPLGTDDEAAGHTPSADRVEMAREAEAKITAAAKRNREGHEAMTERDKAADSKSKESTEEPTKPARQDVQPPGERVDDENSSGTKTTQRQE